MISGKTASDLATIARNGGGLVVDGKRYSANDLAMIGRNLVEGARFEICNSDSFTANDLAMIARNAGNKAIFS
jgi:hypothetical protein